VIPFDWIFPEKHSTIRKNPDGLQDFYGREIVFSVRRFTSNFNL
jgi:hypothetical protein